MKPQNKNYVKLGDNSCLKNDAVLIIAETIKSSCDNLGWQYVYEVLSEYIAIIPLFYDAENILLDLDGNIYDKEIDYALVSIPSDIHIPNFIHIYKKKLQNAKIYAGGFAVSSSVLFFASICDGIFKGAFDSLTEKEYKEISYAVKNKLPPPYFTNEKNAIVKTRNNINRIPSSIILHKESVFKDSFIIEVNRGCPFSCRFCEIPKTNRGVIYYEKDKIIDTIKNKAKGIKKITLIGTAIATHPQLDEIISFLIEEAYEVSFSSMRADRLRRESIELIAKTKTRTITLAPEAGSDRLKKYLNKNITKENLINVLSNALDSGIRKIKLYYIIGIPTETEEDIKDIADEIKSLIEYGKINAKKRKWMPIISVSVNPYIIKPLSENKDESFVSKKEYDIKTKMLEKYIRDIGGVTVSFLNYHEAYCEMMLSKIKNSDIKNFDIHKLSYKKLAVLLSEVFSKK